MNTWLLKKDLNFDHFKISLGNPAIRACPVVRNIFPLGACNNTILWPASGFIVNPATNDTLILFHPNLRKITPDLHYAWGHWAQIVPLCWLF